MPIETVASYAHSLAECQKHREYVQAMKLALVKQGLSDVQIIKVLEPTECYQAGIREEVEAFGRRQVAIDSGSGNPPITTTVAELARDLTTI